MRIKYLFLVLSTFYGFSALAQEKPAEPNPHSAYPIDKVDIQYKATFWRKMDLREKINQPFFSKNSEISKFLLEGVKSKMLDAYSDDSLKTVLTSIEFAERMKDKRIKIKSEFSENELKAGLGGGGKKSKGADSNSDDGWGGGIPSKDDSKSDGDDWGDEGADISKVVTDYITKELYTLRIKENVIIDRKRSRLYFDIQSITLMAPAEKEGVEYEIASFSYNQLHKYFKKRENDCIWFNPNNEMQHRNMADAFDLRLFNAPIIKKGNGADQLLQEEVGGLDASKMLRKSQKLEQQLQDKEAEMWEN